MRKSFAAEGGNTGGKGANSRDAGVVDLVPGNFVAPDVVVAKIKRALANFDTGPKRLTHHRRPEWRHSRDGAT